MDNYFANNLKILRERQGLSQSELARRTENICKSYNESVDDNQKISPITQASIARWEANENSPSIDKVVILKNILNVSIDDLVCNKLN